MLYERDLIAKWNEYTNLSLTVQEPEAARQVYAYDKLLKENMKTALPRLIKNLLKIPTIHSESLPDRVQHTKESEPDILKKVADTHQQTFVLQLEFQLAGDGKMSMESLSKYIRGAYSWL
jgi:preprotein translocase subunit Sec63